VNLRELFFNILKELETGYQLEVGFECISTHCLTAAFSASSQAPTALLLGRCGEHIEFLSITVMMDVVMIGLAKFVPIIFHPGRLSGLGSTCSRAARGSCGAQGPDFLLPRRCHG